MGFDFNNWGYGNEEWDVGGIIVFFFKEIVLGKEGVVFEGRKGIVLLWGFVFLCKGGWGRVLKMLGYLKCLR